MSTDAAADDGVVDGATVRRWTRYGHDRLYVTAVDGARLGYWDNATGVAVLEDEAHRPAFEAALAAHRAQVGPCPSSPPSAPQHAERDEPPPVPAQPGPSPEPLAPLDPVLAGGGAERADLAATRAGAAAREQALALRQAAPVRTFLARALGVKTDERAWRIGADAEEEVAARLAALGSGWRVLHAVPVGDNGSDIDHVVIGPGGVFTINTKHHPTASVWVGGNTFMVNGQRVPYVRNSRYEARRTAKALGAALPGVPCSTTGLIVVMGARRGFTVRSQPPDGDVVVLSRREVARWLGARPDVLTAEQVEGLYAVARWAGTWQR